MNALVGLDGHLLSLCCVSEAGLCRTLVGWGHCATCLKPTHALCLPCICVCLQELAVRSAALEKKESVASALHADLAQREAELATANSEVAALNQRLAAAEARVQELEGGSTVAEAAAVDAQASLAALQVG